MMKKLSLIVIGMVLFFASGVGQANAGVINFASPTLTHFGNFYNEAGAYSLISQTELATSYGDFGWHYHEVYNQGVDFPVAGLFLDQPYTITAFDLQVHSNPFKDFLLQGSNNTTTGWDGDWTTVLSSTVTERAELAVQSWDVSNTTAYSAYRITILNDYTDGGWAMYRWRLLQDDSVAAAGTNAVPEPTSIILFATGLVGAALRKKFVG